MFAKHRPIVIGSLALPALALIERENYLLFHSIAEIVALVVAFAIFILAWNTRQVCSNNYLLILGIASLAIAAIDVLHTLAYKGMGVFSGHGANLPTQLWIAMRLVLSGTFVAAPLFLERKLRPERVLATYGLITLALLATIFTGVFPVCYVDGTGLTPFKIHSEYALCGVLMVSAALLRRHREHFDEEVLRVLLIAIGAMVAAGLCFTHYLSVYSGMNEAGHLLNVFAFALIYVAIVETGLQRPYRLLFRELKQSEEALQNTNAHLAAMNEELEAANLELQSQAEELREQQVALSELSEELASQQALLEAVMQQMPAGVVLVEAPSGRILLGNQELGRLFQRTLHVGEDVREYAEWPRFHPDGRTYGPEEAPILRSLHAGEVVIGEEVEIQRPDGTRRTLSSNAVPIRDREDQVVAVIAVNLDITERRRAEEGLRFLAEAGGVLSSSLDYEATLEGAARLALPMLADCSIVDLVEEEGRIRRVAAAHVDPAMQPLADKLRDYPPDPHIARGIPEVIRTGEPALWDGRADGFFEAIARDEAHLELLRRIGSVSGVTAPLVARGRILGAISFFFTNSGRRHTKEHLALAQALAARAALAVDNARLYRDAQGANAAKDEFLAVLSHELRNPLTPILAGVELLRRTIPQEGRAGHLFGIIERNARLQARLVNDLLDLSRISRGKIHLQRAPHSLDTIVRAMVQDQQTRAEGAVPTLRVDTPEPLWVLGDPERLQQVITNLLTNAIKFTPPEGEVRVRAERCGEAHGRVVVEDTGLGIDRALLPHLFELFRQGEVSGQRQSGLGIGLALVRSLVELHGGRVWAESEGPGKGARFTVELPLVAGPQGTGDRPARAQRDGAIRVLLVEDNPDTRAMLRESLETLGYRVHAAGSAEEGLASLAQARPEVILSDIGLPGVDGYEFIRRARQTPEGATVPAFAVTAYGSKDDVRRAHEAGYLGHFVKPVDVAALDQRLREWLGTEG